MAKVYSWTGDLSYQLLECSGGTIEDPMTFEDIWQYFQDNPIALNYDIPSRLGGNPYELCENNADEWTGKNGLDAPIDDGVDYTKNSYSIKAEVLSVPIADTSVTGISYLGGAIRIYVPNLSLYSLGDHIKISGTTNYNGIYFIYNLNATSIDCRTLKSTPFDAADETFTGECSILKPLSLYYNEDGAENTFGTSVCNEINFSGKSDGLGSPIITGLAVRNWYGTSEDAVRYNYGISATKDFNLTSTWQDFSINIREETDAIGWAKNGASMRGYYNKTKKIILFFDGLSIGDCVWLDGVRFTCSNPNPEKIGLNSYIFNSGLLITDFFRDYGFTVQINLLDTYCGQRSSSSYYDGINFIGTNQGDMQLGDYDFDNSNKEGGSIFFNIFCKEDTGGINLTNIKAQGVSLLTPKDVYGAYNLKGNDSIFRNCNFVNCLNYMSAIDWTFDNCSWMGGRYFTTIAHSITINNTTIYGTSSYPLWVRVSSTSLSPETADTISNIKIIDSTPNKQIIYDYDYGYTADRYARISNLDISEMDDNVIIRLNSTYTAYQNHFLLAFSVELNIVNKIGQPIENAKVVVNDKDGNILWYNFTDVNGNTESKYLDYYEATYNGARYFYFNSTNDWIINCPFTLKISASGYKAYETVLMSNGYDRNLDYVKKGYNQTITLKRSPISIDNEVIC